MRLTAFLYMLARDELPLGAVNRLLGECEKLALDEGDDLPEPRFSDPDLASWAARAADRLGDS